MVALGGSSEPLFLLLRFQIFVGAWGGSPAIYLVFISFSCGRDNAYTQDITVLNRQAKNILAKRIQKQYN